MPYLDFNGLSTTYEVVRCARKMLGVVVSPSGKVVVRAPYSTSDARIADFAERLKPWIFKHLVRYRQTCHPRDFVTGESLPYLGKKLKLVVVTEGAGTAPSIAGSRLFVYVAHDLGVAAQCVAVKQSLVEWYKAQAQQFLVMRLDAIATNLKMYPTAIKVKHQVRRWGSCTARGVISLNWQLVMAPPDVIDYVIIHELCHLKVHGHQREFWEYVARYAPEYKKRRKWLRMNGHEFGFLSG